MIRHAFLAAAVLLLASSAAFAEGVFKGKVYIRGAGGKNWECYEMHLCLSRDGGGYGAPQRIGVIPNEHEKHPASIIRHNGDFHFYLMPGRYTAIVCEPRFFPRGHVFRDIVIEEGKTLQRDLVLPSDYALNQLQTGPWGRVNAQSFKATGTSIIRIAVKVAGIDNNVNNPHIKVVVREGSLKGSAIGPERVIPIKTLADTSVAYRHGDVPTTPGKTYVVEMRTVTPGGKDAGFGWIPFVGPGGAYADGTAFIDGKAVDNDFHIVVMGDREGVIQTLGRITGSDFKSKLPDGWSHEWGQTFKAKGTGLAGVDWYATCGFGKHFIMECVPYDKPDGKPIGPAKIMHSCSDLAYGVSWSPGEVPLEKGKTYCVRFRRLADPDGKNPGFNFYVMRSEDYPDGGLLFSAGGKLVPKGGPDGDIRIFEYDGVKSTVVEPEPMPKALPSSGSSLLQNGDFEQGGPHGVPAGWQAWRSDVKRWKHPTYWNNKGQGRNGSKSHRVLGGQINDTAFDGGVVQRVGGLDPKKRYQLVGYVSIGMPHGAINGAAFGVDRSGQTGNFRAVKWIYATGGGKEGDFIEVVSEPFSPEGDAVSVWTRACLYFFDCGTTYFADFDDVRLVELK